MRAWARATKVLIRRMAEVHFLSPKNAWQRWSSNCPRHIWRLPSWHHTPQACGSLQPQAARATFGLSPANAQHHPPFPPALSSTSIQGTMSMEESVGFGHKYTDHLPHVQSAQISWEPLTKRLRTSACVWPPSPFASAPFSPASTKLSLLFLWLPSWEACLNEETKSWKAWTVSLPKAEQKMATEWQQIHGCLTFSRLHKHCWKQLLQQLSWRHQRHLSCVQSRRTKLCVQKWILLTTCFASRSAQTKVHNRLIR